MRDKLAKAFEDAMAGTDKRRACMMRLIAAAVRDRDVTMRAGGRDRLCELEIQDLLRTMVRQREAAAIGFEKGGKPQRAADERAEIGIIAEFLPEPLVAGEMEAACREVVADTGSRGLRDVGRAMTALRNRYGGRMNFADASIVVRDLLR